MKYVTVRVANSDGSPARDARVGIDVHQFAAGGTETGYTNGDGQANFQLNIDDSAEITIM